MFNLIEEKWIPVIRRSGSISMMAPWEISDKEDPPLKIRFTRQDMNSAVTQFLVGLIQTTMTPTDEDEWLDLLENRPSPEELKIRMSSVKDAFELIGGPHPFMQEPGIEGKKLIDSLILTTPGENTVKLNKDFFIKRNSGENCLCLSCTAAAVYTMQALAPVGGSGYSCSIRGSCPLTTILEGEDLFTTIALNVLSQNNLVGDSKDIIFPWMSDIKSNILYASENNPLMVYWTTVRRISLGDVVHGRCILCGMEGSAISDYNSVNKGTTFRDWVHPLCPYSSDLKPVMVRDNIGHFDQWTYMIYDIGSEIRPAMAVSQLKRNRKEVSAILGDNHVRLWINGYLNDKALVKSWKEIRQPILMNFDNETEILIRATIKKLITLTNFGLKKLNSALNILYGPRDLNKRGKYQKIPTDMKEHFWSECDSIFPEVVKKISSEYDPAIISDWGSSLRNITLSIFDEYSDSLPLDYYQNVAHGRRFLLSHLSDKTLKKELSK